MTYPIFRSSFPCSNGTAKHESVSRQFAYERADGAVETAEDVRRIVVDMENSNAIPTTAEVRPARQLLAHPSVGAVEQDEEGHPVTTDHENGVKLVRFFGDIVQPPSKEE